MKAKSLQDLKTMRQAVADAAAREAEAQKIRQEKERRQRAEQAVFLQALSLIHI
mgnify:CR=1 FL=1